MKTPEEKEAIKKAKAKRDRRLFYLGMAAGGLLSFIMILLNRI